MFSKDEVELKKSDKKVEFKEQPVEEIQFDGVVNNNDVILKVNP